MRFIFAILIISVLSYLAELIFPWWVLTIVCFGTTFIMRVHSGKAFLAGFSGIFILWLLVAGLNDIANGHILSSRMAALFQLPNYILFLLVGAFLGGLIGGLSGWSGATVRNYFQQKH